MNWATLPGKLKCYILLLTALAVPVILQAVTDLVWRPPADNGWIILAILATATLPFFLYLPSVNSAVLIGDAYIMSIAMMYGPSPCVVATLAHTLAASLLIRKQSKLYTYRLAFNSASTICGSWLYSNIYLYLNHDLSMEVSRFLLPALALALTFFIFNSFITAVAISWASGRKIFEYWTASYLPLAIDFSVSSVSASFIVSLHYLGKYVPFAAAPLVGVVWGWHKVNQTKAMEAERHLKEQEQLYLRTVESLALAVDAKDQVTYGHIRRVRAYSMEMARLCGIKDQRELMAIETGALLHDIGKLAVEDYILNKPGPLSNQEFEKMKVHSEAGDEILRQIQFPFPVANYVRFHHERWNGVGYPDHLKGEEIPLGARILAVADAFDAMRSSRPYKLSIRIDDVLSRLKADAGTLYDPRLVDLFVTHIDELEAAAEEAVRNMAELSLRKYFEKIDHQELQGEPYILTSTALSGSAVELMQLAELSSVKGGSLDLIEILQILAQRIRRLVPYTSCVFFFDSGHDSLNAVYAAGEFSDILGRLSIDMGKGISGWAAAYRQPMLNAKPALEFRGAAHELLTLTDALVVPISVADNCLGTISLYSEVPNTYTRTHEELIRTIASIVTPILTDARDRTRTHLPTDHIDPVTRVYTSAYLSVAGAGLIAAAEQSKAPLSLVNLEVSNLRQVTNLYGPASADLIMGKVADAFRLDLRETDVLARFGSQGFVALLPGMRQEQAQRWAQTLQQRARSITISTGQSQGVYANCHIAVSSFPEAGADIFTLIASARQSLVAHTKSRKEQDAESPASVVGFPPRN